MKPYICTKTDWDYEVIDVFLVIENMDDIHLKGFDDVDWQKADEYAESIASMLNLEFVGDRTDT
jgi:hypothetical protein